MNKQDAIKKINTMGKVGQIVSIVIEVLLGIAAIGVIIATICFIAIPKDFLSVVTTTQVNTMIDLNKLPGVGNMDLQALEKELNEETSNGSLEVDGNVMAVAGVTIDDGVMDVSTEVSTNNFDLKKLIPVCLSAFLQIVCAFVSVLFVAMLCKNFKTCESPFEEGVINGLKKVAFSLIPLAVLDSITSSFVSAIESGNVKIQLSVNLVMVFTILIIFALAYIFKYGAILQKESDETL